jgi:hypothetical protein
VGDVWSQLVVMFEEHGGEIKYIKLLKIKRERDNTLKALQWWLNSDNLARFLLRIRNFKDIA